MAFYSLVHTGTVYEQQWQNQYNYQTNLAVPVTGGAEDLVTEFLADVAPKVGAIQRLSTAQFQYRTIYAVDVYDDTDFFEYVYAPNSTGLRGGAGPALSPFISYSFRTERWRVKRNRGYKRFAGICEDDVTGNDYDPGGTIIADIAAQLGTELIGALETYYPTIAGKEEYVPDPEKPLKTAYKYYDTETEEKTESSGVIEWLGYRLTTQRSRIQGQGA